MLFTNWIVYRRNLRKSDKKTTYEFVASGLIVEAGRNCCCGSICDFCNGSLNAYRQCIRNRVPGLRLARPEARRAHPGLTMCRHVVAGLSGWKVGDSAVTATSIIQQSMNG